MPYALGFSVVKWSSVIISAAELHFKNVIVLRSEERTKIDSVTGAWRIQRVKGNQRLACWLQLGLEHALQLQQCWPAMAHLQVKIASSYSCANSRCQSTFTPLFKLLFYPVKHLPYWKTSQRHMEMAASGKSSCWCVKYVQGNLK